MVLLSAQSLHIGLGYLSLFTCLDVLFFFLMQIVTLLQKLVGYAKLESLSEEITKEINDILVQTSEIPKAPWDEGICKVCGVDKDDDSVLLCDTCDAEYHTYCLEPPLVRIPEGNWYCPSCVVRNSMVQGASEHSQVGGQHKGKNNQGEITRLCLEALRHLTTVMEEKEYWEFNVHEVCLLILLVTYSSLTFDDFILLLHIDCIDLLPANLAKDYIAFVYDLKLVLFQLKLKK